MDNINLIWEIAWSFCKTTQYKIDWEELFAEACLAYLEALHVYKPEKNCKETSFAYHCMRNRLIDFCKAEFLNMRESDIYWHEEDSFLPDYEFFGGSFTSLPRSDVFKAFSKETRTILNLISREPLKYAVPPRKALGKIRERLREKGWALPKIDESIRVLKKELS